MEISSDEEGDNKPVEEPPALVIDFNLILKVVEEYAKYFGNRIVYIFSSIPLYTCFSTLDLCVLFNP